MSRHWTAARPQCRTPSDEKNGGRDATLRYLRIRFFDVTPDHPAMLSEEGVREAGELGASSADFGDAATCCTTTSFDQT
jgi:hypothetical protein